jgi:predicted dienelactone hydrolase
VTGSDAPTPAIRMLTDESRPDLRGHGSGRPVRVYDWSAGLHHDAPLVAISHGTGGSGRDMGWLARPLVAAGLRVVSVDHHGNNHVDGYHPEGFLFGWERPRDITFVLDSMTGVDRVGVAGFSLGGYTAAALAGARLDRSIIEAILAGEIALPPIAELPDALERLLASTSPAARSDAADRAAGDLKDPRVVAAFLVAPGLGSLMTPQSLGAVRIPLEVRWGDADTTNPFDSDIRPLLDHAPRVHGEPVVGGVRHEHFIEPLAPDRTAARGRVAADAVRFFTEQLG